LRGDIRKMVANHLFPLVIRGISAWLKYKLQLLKEIKGVVFLGN